VGIPARQTCWISAAGYKLDFDEHGFANCIRTNEKYQLQNNIVTKI
jgi:UDP-2-acetamido-3-amino-2,3-dideoxy-glucuronate N-acetyltransferase